MILQISLYALVPAVFAASAWLWARTCVPHAGLAETTAVAAISIVSNAMLVMLGLHITGIAITQSALLLANTIPATAAVACFVWRRPSWLPPAQDNRACFLVVLGLFSVLVLPVTHLTGIDTYKWQDLASSVAVEHCIPWFVHPSSLWGFTPRSYPSLQPLFLSSVQIMTGLGVDWGFYLVSLVFGAAGLANAYLLGRAIFPQQPDSALRVAVLYTFAPLFMRYNHWPTGRGLFLALFPAFIAAGLGCHKLRYLPVVAILALLVTLSHKTGLVGVPLALAALACTPLVPASHHRWVRFFVAVPFVLAATAFAPTLLLAQPAGAVLGTLRLAAVRFAWMMPAAALVFLPLRLDESAIRLRRMLPGLLLTLPAAFVSEPYGALIALPYVTVAAVAGLDRLAARASLNPARLWRLAILITFIGAIGTVGYRNTLAIPPRVYAAARFLDQYDPNGPYELSAPGRHQQRMQAYLRGCPRFSIIAPANARLRILPPPSLSGPPPAVLKEWTRYMRHMVSLEPLTAYFYGPSPRRYYVTVDDTGAYPVGAACLYAQDGVKVWAPHGQAPSVVEKGPDT